MKAGHRKTPKEKQPPEETFENEVEQVRQNLWRKLHPTVRKFIVFAIVIGAPVVSTFSWWYPPLERWWNKPPDVIQFDGIIYEQGTNPARVTLQLVDKDGMPRTQYVSGENGLVSCSLPDNIPIRKFRYLYHARWDSVDVDYGSIKRTRHFTIDIQLRRIQYP